MTNEKWEWIEGFVGYYEISNTGKIASFHRSKRKELKQYPQYHDGVLVYLSKPHQKRRALYVHRLVAQTFIPNPKDKPEVNHKDGNRRNNHVDNLEWVTHQENIRHAYEVLGRKGSTAGVYGKYNKKSKPVLQKLKDGTLVKRWDCQMDVERETDMKAVGVSQACTGYRPSYRGYLWEYA